jgi:hypothetical protein
VFVIWEPVLPTDFGAPSTATLRRISDPRAFQYWDKEHLVSSELGETDRSSVVWDYVAVFSPGTLWDKVPSQPAYSHVPVIKGIDGTRDTIAGLLRESLGAQVPRVMQVTEDACGLYFTSQGLASTSCVTAR